MINRVPGTQDILNTALFNALTTIIRSHLTRASFAEIITPILEHIELFQRSLGTTTDVMSKEIYQVTTHHADKEEESTICLRPEATASIMRAYLNAPIVERPWRAFTIGPMFRHERPQKGRYRQFTQANFEIIGSTVITEDVRLITLLDRLFTNVLQMQDYALLINFMGCREDRATFLAKLKPFLAQHAASLCSACTHRAEHNPLRIFDCKKAACQELYRTAPAITDHLCGQCQEEWVTLKHGLENLNVSFSYQPHLVRGLDYYEKTVFEFVSLQLGAQNTFCGGGRYNHLSVELGASEAIPSLGAAIGIERLMLLTEQTLGAQLLEQPLVMVLPLGAEQQSLGLHLADLLHSNQERYVVDCLLGYDSMKKLLQQANKRGARYALIIGSNERLQGTVMIKHMTLGTEEVIAQRDLVAYITQ